ncbi:methyltransferase family protein [Thalassotalea profundi]|nr:isoprenylcysteine carboxylmethyltransferase family protein [Thalassotalea profundi]
MMKHFELKIPPLLVLVCFAGFMWLTAHVFEQQTIDIKYNILISLSFLSLAFLILLASSYRFKKAKTTVNPIKPDNSSSLVTSGIYGFSRNPMYLSFAMMLTALGIYLSTIQALVCVPVFVVFINQFQIKPEEKALLQIFGNAYSNYKKSVRRWL